jgi:DNA-binding Lrp family transcriptional regulator
MLADREAADEFERRRRGRRDRRLLPRRGAADFLLEVVVPDLAAYERLLLETIMDLPGVTDVRSNIAIRTIKEAGPLPLDRAAERSQVHRSVERP